MSMLALCGAVKRLGKELFRSLFVCFDPQIHKVNSCVICVCFQFDSGDFYFYSGRITVYISGGFDMHADDLTDTDSVAVQLPSLPQTVCQGSHAFVITIWCSSFCTNF